MIKVGKVVKPDYPYTRLEGEKRDQFIHHYDESMTREETLRLVASLAAKGEEPEAIELHAYAEGFCRGFFSEPSSQGLRRGDKEKYGKTGENLGHPSNKHIDNGRVNAWFTRRQMSGDFVPSPPKSEEKP